MSPIPQIILVLLLGIATVHDFLNWGRLRPVSFPLSLLGTAAILVLLILGGFFG